MELDTPKLLVHKVTKVFHNGRQDLDVLASIDLTVDVGKFVSVIGPSGCGKSTLFNIIAGVEQLSSGRILIDGDANPDRRGKTGYMPQQPLLLPWRTVEENVMLGLDVRHVQRAKAKDEAYELLKRFGLADFAQHYPATLSGGMRQRVALLRTVLFNHSFLLLDEPFGALDALTRLSSQMWLLDVWHEFSPPFIPVERIALEAQPRYRDGLVPPSVLFITHDVREATLLSDCIYVFSARPARVVRRVDIDLPRPRKPEHLAMEQAVQLEQELLALLLKEQKEQQK